MSPTKMDRFKPLAFSTMNEFGTEFCNFNSNIVLPKQKNSMIVSFAFVDGAIFPRISLQIHS